MRTQTDLIATPERHSKKHVRYTETAFWSQNFWYATVVTDRCDDYVQRDSAVAAPELNKNPVCNITVWTFMLQM